MPGNTPGGQQPATGGQISVNPQSKQSSRPMPQQQFQPPPQTANPSLKRPVAATLCQSNTPKAVVGPSKKVVNVISVTSSQYQQNQQRVVPQPVLSASQQQMLFENRKRSAETQFYQQQQQQVAIHSKSTKVSPTRGQQKQQFKPTYDAGKPEPLLQPQYYNFDIEGIAPALVSHTAGAHIPMKNHLMMGVPKKDINIMANNTLSASTNNMQMTHHQNSEDLNMDSSMHQSFINLIYPSKSKKLMSNEAQKQSSKDQIQSGPHHQKSKSHYVGGSQNHHMVQNFVKPVAQQLAPKSGSSTGGVQKIQQSSYKKQSSIFNYSQRFKELLNETMGDQDQVQQPPQASQISGPLHKSHQNQYQAFSQHHSPTQSKANQGYSLANPSHIMVNFNDIQLQQQRSSLANIQQQSAAHMKSTFDKPLVSQSQQPGPHTQYLSMNDQAAMISSGMNTNPAGNTKTIDHQYARGQSGPGMQNTPNGKPNSKNGQSNTIVVVSSKAKVIAEPHNGVVKQNLLMAAGAPQGSLHQRKPSHPVTNNFMLELLSGPHNSQVNQQHNLASSFVGGSQPSHHHIDLSTSLSSHPASSSRPGEHLRQQSQPQHHQLAQYQQLQPVREKKQHQPTQSKLLQNKHIPGTQQSHQRSASDYLQQQQQNENNLLRFLNNESYDEATQRHLQQQMAMQQEDMIESFENLDCTTVTHSGQVNLGQDSSRVAVSNPASAPATAANSFMQQAFSQMLYDGSSQAVQLSHRQSSLVSQVNPHLVNPGGNSNQLSAVSSSSSIYHQRKLSMQQQPGGSSSTHTLQVKKSPGKKVILSGGGAPAEMMAQQVNYQKISNKRRSSPSTVTEQPQFIGNVQQQVVSGGVAMAAQKKSNPVFIKSNQQSISQPATAISQSLRTSQVSSPSGKHQHKISLGGGQQMQVVMAGHHHTNSSSSIGNHVITSMPGSQQQLLQGPQHNRSNSDLMKQQILTAQAAVMKKQQANRPNPAINNPQSTPVQTQQPKAKSEMTTPRQMQAKISSQQPKKGVTPTTNAQPNVSIDLSKQSTGRGGLSKNGSSSNLQQHTPRLKQTSPQQPKAVITTQPIVAASAGMKRYSMQNSPRVVKQQQQQYNINQQYQMFQQVMAKKGNGKVDGVSPKASSSALGGKKEEGDHRRGVSETEHLLNQIRNNINTLKAYQGGPPEPVVQVPYPKHTSKEEPAYKKRNNLVLAAEDSGSYQQLQTDPNMSPYSKDLSKLQRLIRFNFRKYNEPPGTTSEFYRIGRVLGRGAFGKVNLAAHKLSEQLVAIKSINKEFLRSSKHNNKEQKVPTPANENVEHPEKKKVMQEFAILKQSNHQSVVRLYDTFETNKHICFVMELCAGGDLLTYVRKRRKLTEDVAKYFFKQLIEGLAYLHHSKLIVHRDIKLDNILLDANGKIKIADFGVSRQVQTEAERMSEQCGTPAYIAPEILKDKGYEGFKVDVWSAGVCLYAMLIGTVPFKAGSMQELHHLIINGKYDIHNPNANCSKDNQPAAAQPTQPVTKISDHAVNLIHSLLQVDPRKRLSAVEVLSHPWLKDCKEELDVFTQKEKDVIKKEYLSKNIERISNNQKKEQTGGFEETEVVFTEHNLDTRTNIGSLLKNASTKSIILAPFNSTVSEITHPEEEQKTQYQWPEEIRKMIVPKRILKFAPKVKDLDRQYEHNNNADLDNGVYNNIGNEDDPAANKDGASQDSGLSDQQDSLKRSFKDTELSSDDEHAEQQLEHVRRQKQQEQSELEEFEKQVQRLKYTRYQEPVEVIDLELVTRLSSAGAGVYPKEYLMQALGSKEMNYATAMYHLALKKQQMIAKQQQMQQAIIKELFQPQGQE